MHCPPTEMQILEPSDAAELRARYIAERDKRIVKSGAKQYERPEDEFADTYEHDPYMPRTEREALAEVLDVAVLGGGWTGVLAGYHLRQEGVAHFRHIGRNFPTVMRSRIISASSPKIRAL